SDGAEVLERADAEIVNVEPAAGRGGDGVGQKPEVRVEGAIGLGPTDEIVSRRRDASLERAGRGDPNPRGDTSAQASDLGRNGPGDLHLDGAVRRVAGAPGDPIAPLASASGGARGDVVEAR